MANTLIDVKDTARPTAQPLSPSVRRHLGRSLRTFYATALTAPVSERIEALLARLDAPKR